LGNYHLKIAKIIQRLMILQELGKVLSSGEQETLAVAG
jgi:hypothetical protein